MNYMVIDIGSNTVKCDIFQTTENDFVNIFHKSRVMGFLSHLNNGVLSDMGYLLLIDILNDYSCSARLYDCANIFAFATASFRSCSHPEELINKVYKDIGIKIQLFSGITEGSMSFLGVMHSHPEAVDGVTLDMGGGSTEVNLFEKRESKFLCSLPFGALSMKNKFANRSYQDEGISAFATREELELIYRRAIALAKSYNLPVCKNGTGYIVGGSARAIGFLCASPDENGITKFDYPTLCEMIERYSSIDNFKAEYLVKSLPDRYQLVVPAAAAYKGIFELMNITEITVAAGGIKEGYMYYLMQKGLHT